MFGALLYLTGQWKTAAVGMLIPLIFGSTGVLTELVYGLTALIFILAVGVAVAPAPIKTVAEGLISHLETAVEDAMPKNN
jgi:hypothetical protein